MENYIKLDYLDLIRDVQDIYWEHIIPIARYVVEDKLVTGRYARPGFQVSSVFINKEEPRHDPLKKIFRKYNFLSHHLLVIAVDPGAISPIHMDGGEKKRPLSLNIPIQGCDLNCTTEFFSMKEENFWLCQRTSTRWEKDGVETPKVDEYRLTDYPVLMNPQVPHRVNSLEGKSQRLTVNWTARLDWRFEDAVEYFKSQNKIILN